MRFIIFILTFLTPVLGWACGGLFCNNARPVNQAAERILFAVENEQITMVVQIQYEGPPSDFGWLLPVPADTEYALASEELFVQLDQSFAPQFRLNRDWGPNCDFPLAAAERSAVDDADGASNGVDVLSQQSLGPFEITLLRAASVMDLRDWLDTNEYQIPNGVDEKLIPYLERDQVFLALKLLAGKDAGDISPLRLTFRGNTPTIPIVPTSVAANPDMGIIAMVLGNHRAIPTNYQHVVINDAALNWLGQGDNYADVVSQAADEADNGHAFTTDFAGQHEGNGYPSLVNPDQIAELEDVRDLAGGIDVLESLLVSDQAPFTPDADVLRLMRGTITVPEGKSVDAVLACLRCNEEDQDISVDGPALAQALTDLNEGRAEIKRLFDTLPYLSRLYGTMSPSEMTMDPVFAFNRDLGEVDNIRTATLEIRCEESGRTIAQTLVTESGLRVDLPLGDNPDLIQRQNGETVRGMETMGAAVITQEMEAGMGEVIADNSAMIQAKYDGDAAPRGGSTGPTSPSIGGQPGTTATTPSTRPSAGVDATNPPGEPDGLGGAVTVTGSAAQTSDGGSAGCACDSGTQNSPSMVLTLLILGGAGLRRRVHRRHIS
ncbi:MAG: DUF2330 domain-containing protein [Myxococcota bacterium]|nr:DUF2330 domain-containing protein [Myxococcota bacterium]